jgi:hypothetical protein
MKKKLHVDLPILHAHNVVSWKVDILCVICKEKTNVSAKIGHWSRAQIVLVLHIRVDWINKLRPPVAHCLGRNERQHYLDRMSESNC